MSSTHKYLGPSSAITLRTADGRDVELVLTPGAEFDLPALGVADHEYIRTLAALGHLSPLAADPAPARTSTSKKKDL